jgi:hypothetical protein
MQRLHLCYFEEIIHCIRLQIEKLKEQADAKEAELLALLELTPIQIWNTDLDNFLEAWKVSLLHTGVMIWFLSHRVIASMSARIGRTEKPVVPMAK